MVAIKAKLMLVMGYLGAVIGAGFASGQEIMQFFVAYGLYGLNGVVISCLLFSLAAGMLLYMAHSRKVSNYQDMLLYLLGEKAGKIVDFLLAIFLFLGISTMFSASGAVFYEHLHLPKTLGIFLAYSLVAVFLLTGKKGLILSYNILVPIKLILLLAISGYAAFFVPGDQVETYTAFLCPSEVHFWALSSILYVAYNFALAMVILTAYQSVTSRRDGVSGAMLGGLLLGVLVLFNYIALCKFLPGVLNYEVPMLFIAGHISLGTKQIYTVVLWVGILTTAIANAYGFAQRFAAFTQINYRLSLLLCITLALPVSMRSFSALVGQVYPVFGLLGVIILTALVYKSIKDIAGELYYNIMQLLKGI